MTRPTAACRRRRSASRSTPRWTACRPTYVDLYQAHRFDTRTPIEETIEGLQRVVADGKARYLGFSEWSPEQVQAAIDIAGPGLFVSSQPQYSMLWQAPEAEIFPLCAANGISQVVWSPLAQGLLTGKYRPGQPPPAGSRATSDAMNVSLGLVMKRRPARGGGPAAPGRPAGGPVPGRARAGLGAAPARTRLGDHRRFPPRAGPRQREGLRRHPHPDTLAAIDEALGDAPVKEPTPAPFARPGITHR